VDLIRARFTKLRHARAYNWYSPCSCWLYTLTSCRTCSSVFGCRQLGNRLVDLQRNALLCDSSILGWLHNVSGGTASLCKWPPAVHHNTYPRIYV